MVEMRPSFFDKSKKPGCRRIFGLISFLRLFIEQFFPRISLV